MRAQTQKDGKTRISNHKLMVILAVCGYRVSFVLAHHVLEKQRRERELKRVFESGCASPVHPNTGLEVLNAKMAALCTNGDVQHVGDLLKGPCGTILAPEYGHEWLYLAMKYDRLDVFCVLLQQKNMRVNGVVEKSDRLVVTTPCTPLRMSMMSGRASAYFEQLIRHPNIDVNEMGSRNGRHYHDLLLHSACRYGDANCARLLLRHKDIIVNPIDLYDVQSTTHPLCVPAYDRHLPSVQILMIRHLKGDRRLGRRAVRGARRGWRPLRRFWRNLFN